MSITVRSITADEVDEFIRVDSAAFGSVPTAEELARMTAAVEVGRSIAAFDGAKMCGTAGAFSFELTLPGGALPPVAGVSWVGVAPTHRRRGALTTMMRHQLAEVRERGEPAAVLLASEAPIYGRFGYGLATQARSVKIATAHAPYRPDVAVAGGVRLLDGDDDARLAVLGQVFDEARRLQPGELPRSDAWWRRRAAEPTPGRSRFDAVHEGPDGAVDGFATYYVKNDWSSGMPNSQLAVRDLCAVTGDARVALWRFLLDVDLVREVSFWNLDPNDPLPWLLADSRQLQTTLVADHLWLRPLDVAALLGARTYEGEGTLVLEVHDPLFAEVGGRFRLEVDATGAATCERAPDREPDVTLGVAVLGALVLGGGVPSVLAAAGWLAPASPGALALADRLLPTARAPWSTTRF